MIFGHRNDLAWYFTTWNLAYLAARTSSQALFCTENRIDTHIELIPTHIHTRQNACAQFRCNN